MVLVHCSRPWEKEEENKARITQKENAPILFLSMIHYKSEVT